MVSAFLANPNLNFTDVDLHGISVSIITINIFRKLMIILFRRYFSHYNFRGYLYSNLHMLYKSMIILIFPPRDDVLTFRVSENVASPRINRVRPYIRINLKYDEEYRAESKFSRRSIFPRDIQENCISANVLVFLPFSSLVVSFIFSSALCLFVGYQYRLVGFTISKWYGLSCVHVNAHTHAHIWEKTVFRENLANPMLSPGCIITHCVCISENKKGEFDTFYISWLLLI